MPGTEYGIISSMGNPVGSLTNYQKSLVIGSLLGDGYLRRVPGRNDAFLEINHSIKQKEYVDWKYKVLGNITGGPPKERKSGKNRIAYRFYTRQNEFFTKIHGLFYRNGVKVIPENLILDSIIISVWFMDDGSMCRPDDVYLNTQQFKIKDQEKLIKKLNEVGIEAKLNKDKKYKRIRLIKSSIKKMIDIVEPHIISEMRYKIGYDPVETTRRSPAVVLS